MREFDHYSPQSLPEALALAARFNGKKCWIAGGTDLILLMKEEVLSPDVVINIKNITELKDIHITPDQSMRIGATTTLQELTRNPIILRDYPILAQAGRLMASEQIRSTATVGGNLCNASPAADLCPPMIVLNAELKVVSQDGQRTLPIEDFFLGPGKTVLKPGELLTEIRLPPLHGKAVYKKHTTRECMDIAIASLAIWLDLDENLVRDIRVALGAVAPIPLRVKKAEISLRGQPLSIIRIKDAAEIAANEASPIDDTRGSAWYRRRIIQVLFERTLTALAEVEGV